MCGIVGGVFWGGRTDPSAARTAVGAMVDAVAHRGPDGRGVYTSRIDEAASGAPFAVLGHTRLAIIDVSEAGAQPMGGPADAPWITFNGEIYNFSTLRTELQQGGAHFTSHSDTETILRGYDAWGRDVLPRLRGMFALAIWDDRQQRLLIARDRLGIKPVYWYRGDGFLLFSSEVRALMKTGLIPPRVDAAALWQYLGYQSIPAPRSLVDGVSAMAPASWLTVSATGDVATGEYWRMLDATMRPADVSQPEAETLVGAKLRDAVAAHMVSDVPVGAFLSGGIDSSAVVALMAETGATPQTFSVGFDEQAFDETVYARAVAERFGTNHTHVPLRSDDMLAQLPGALAAMDQPSGDAVNTYIVSGAVRERGLKVALSGLGGDEIFGGYPSFARLMRVAGASRVWGRAPEPLRQLAASAMRAVGGDSIAVGKAASLVASDGEISSMFPLTRQVLSVEQRRQVMSNRVLAMLDGELEPYDRLLADAFEDVPAATTFTRISFAEARTYMHDVLLRDTDQMSMAHALEVRVPLLDHELIELVVSLPDSVKKTTGTPKRLLVDSLGPLLPREIVHRPKQGFTLPFDPWMRGPLRQFCERHLGENGLAGRGLFDPAAIADLWSAFERREPRVSWSRIWVLVTLDAWFERNGVGA